MAKILVNRATDDVVFSLNDSLILMAYTSNALTRIEYLSEEDGRKRSVDVKETLAQVGGASDLLVSTTMLDGTAVWLNEARVNSVADINSKAVLYFDENGSSLRRLKLNITAVVWKASVINKPSALAFITDSFTAAPNTIVLDAAEGDQTGLFTAGKLVTVFGEGDANDAIFTVVSSAWTTVTTITVTETPVVNATGTGFASVKA